MRELKNIVMIDDDPSANYLFKHCLKSLRMQVNVTMYKYPEKALSDFMNGSISTDLIILDINLPKLTGWELLDKLYEFDLLKKECTVFMLSTSVFEKDKLRINRYVHVKEYIVKPITTEKITNIFSKYFHLNSPAKTT